MSSDSDSEHEYMNEILVRQIVEEEMFEPAEPAVLQYGEQLMERLAAGVVEPPARQGLDEDPAVAMYRRLRRDFRIVRRHDPGEIAMQKQLRLRIQQSLNMVSCSRPMCTTCVGRADVARRLPDSVFRPHSLKQQILLQLGNQFYPLSISGKRQEALQQLGLPDPVLAELQRVLSEMETWRKEFLSILDVSAACYVPALHWHPHGIGVNWRKTAEMIVENADISGRAMFLLSAFCCLEDKVDSVWRYLAPGVKHHLTTQQTASGDDNPILSYWVVKCLGRDPNHYLKSIVYHSILKKYQEALEYFWPLATAAATDDSSQSAGSLSYLYDHSFHQAIENGNKAAAYFIWGRATRPQRVSMISAASCCSTRGSYYGFECAVAAGYTDLVRFLWQKATDQERNGMLLAEHCNSFCQAAANGSMEIVEMMWNETSKTQRFVLLFEQSAAAFRKAAGNGHLKIVKMLWSAANQHQRRQLLGVSQGEALTKAAANGRKEVLEYLCSEMNEEAKDFFFSSILAPCISAALENGRRDTVKFLLTLPRDEAEFRRVVWSDGADVFWKAFHEAKVSTDWRQVHSMFSVLNKDQTNAVIDKLESEYPNPVVSRYLELLRHPERVTERSRSRSLRMDCPMECKETAMEAVEDGCRVPSTEEEKVEVDEGVGGDPEEPMAYIP